LHQTVLFLPEAGSFQYPHHKPSKDMEGQGFVSKNDQLEKARRGRISQPPKRQTIDVPDSVI
jgi:hypothetical protein